MKNVSDQINSPDFCKNFFTVLKQKLTKHFLQIQKLLEITILTTAIDIYPYMAYTTRIQIRLPLFALSHGSVHQFTVDNIMSIMLVHSYLAGNSFYSLS